MNPPAHPTKTGGLSLSLRLSLWYATVFVATTLALYTVAYLVLKDSIEQREKSLVTARLDDYASLLQRGGVPLLQQRFQDERRTELEALFIRVQSPGSNALLLSDPTGHAHTFSRQIAGLDTSTSASWLRLESQTGTPATLFLASRKIPPDITLQVGHTTNADASLLAHFQSIFVSVVAPVLLLGILGGALLTYRAMRPLRTVAATAQNIVNTGDLQQRVPSPNGRSELAELVTLFNQMLDRTDKLVASMHGSLDNVAHDLRTPMTRLRSTAENALTLPDLPGESAAREALADCLEESDRVLAMLDALMDIAEAETGTMRLNLEPVDLAGLVRTTAEIYQFVAEEKPVTISIDAPAPVPDNADRPRLQQLLGNLADNAIKFADPDTTVVLGASTSETGQPVLRVTNHGPAIPAAECNKIWQRLYRTERSRHHRG
ncbi:MAG: HAMP domain-containing protein, partial [Verrucomicrobiales bacterium]|nr:HAMP domain-containing protein [Verrucomicrobiales bacterium]